MRFLILYWNKEARKRTHTSLKVVSGSCQPRKDRNAWCNGCRNVLSYLHASKFSFGWSVRIQSVVDRGEQSGKQNSWSHNQNDQETMTSRNFVESQESLATRYLEQPLGPLKSLFPDSSQDESDECSTAATSDEQATTFHCTRKWTCTHYLDIMSGR